jgi:NADH:ubiquinone oxidoreductase subunit 6 (subunit J)
MTFSARSRRVRGWIVDLVVGGLVGGVVGAVAAVNVVIVSGAERGYESSLGEVFRHNVFAGLVTVAVLVAGLVGGVVVARRRRSAAGAGDVTSP